MRLSVTDVSNCCLVFGSGDDLQPLLRVNQLLTPQPIPNDPKERHACVFVYLTKAPPVGAPFQGLLERMTVLNSQYQAGALTMVSPPQLVSMEQVAFSKSLLPPSVVPAALSSTKDLIDGHTFLALEMLLERRIAGVKRLIRVLLLHADPIAMFWGLSDDGRVAPQVLVTVPAMPLGRRWGALERILTRFRCDLPRLWIKGDFPHRGRRGEPGRAPSVLSRATPLYPRRACVFRDWDATLGCETQSPGDALRDRSTAHVAGFAPESQGIKIVLNAVGHRGEDGEVSLSRPEDSHERRPALIVTAAGESGQILCPQGSVHACWEELQARRRYPRGLRLPAMPLREAIHGVQATALSLGLPRVVMHLPSFEDELALVLVEPTRRNPGVHVAIVTDHCLGVLGFGDIDGALQVSPWTR